MNTIIEREFSVFLEYIYIYICIYLYIFYSVVFDSDILYHVLSMTYYLSLGLCVVLWCLFFLGSIDLISSV